MGKTGATGTAGATGAAGARGTSGANDTREFLAPARSSKRYQSYRPTCRARRISRNKWTVGPLALAGVISPGRAGRAIRAWSTSDASRAPRISRSSGGDFASCTSRTT